MFVPTSSKRAVRLNIKTALIGVCIFLFSPFLGGGGGEGFDVVHASA